MFVKSAVKFEAARLHFLSDVFVALPSLLLKLPTREVKERETDTEKMRRNHCKPR